MTVMTKPITASTKKRDFSDVHAMVITANKRVRDALKIVQNRQSYSKYYAIQFIVK